MGMKDKYTFTMSLTHLKMSETRGMCRSVMPCVDFATLIHNLCTLYNENFMSCLLHLNNLNSVIFLNIINLQVHSAHRGTDALLHSFTLEYMIMV